VQRRHHRQRVRLQDGAGEDRRHRVGHRVVHVHEVELVVAGDLDDLGGERQRVGRVLEERIVRHHHLVVEEPRLGRRRLEQRQARRERVADDVHLVAAGGERHGELGGDDAGAAVGR
jgi:hypothetical protein